MTEKLSSENKAMGGEFIIPPGFPVGGEYKIHPLCCTQIIPKGIFERFSNLEINQQGNIENFKTLLIKALEDD